jgi:hypothetical protein
MTSDATAVQRIPTRASVATRVAQSGRNFGRASERCVSKRPRCREQEMARAVGPATERVTICKGDHGRHGAGHVQRRVTSPTLVSFLHWCTLHQISFVSVCVIPCSTQHTKAHSFCSLHGPQLLSCPTFNKAICLSVCPTPTASCPTARAADTLLKPRGTPP